MNGLLQPYTEEDDSFTDFRGCGKGWGIHKSCKQDVEGTSVGRIGVSVRAKVEIDRKIWCNGFTSEHAETNGEIFDNCICDGTKFSSGEKNEFCEYEAEWKPLCNHRTCEPPPAAPPPNKEDSKLDAGDFPIIQHKKPTGSCDKGTMRCPAEEQFAALQLVLRDLGLPATIDRSMQPRRTTRNDIAIVYLTELEEGLAPFMEGNRQYPGSTLLVLTRSWLSRIPSKFDSTQDWLYVHKAITSDAGGQTYVDCFMPPRRATYIVNHIIGPVTDYRRYEGEEVTRFGLDCPMASTQPLSKRADNKLLTRMMCASAGVGHPITLGFWLPGQSGDVFLEHHPTINVIKLPDKDVNAAWIHPHVSQFLYSEVMRNFNRIVVKPFGCQWNTCKGVSFHSNTDVTGIVMAILDLLTEVEDGDGVLVDSFHGTFEPLVSSCIGHHAINVEGINLGYRVRSIVSRTPQNGARMTMVVCGVANNDEPISGLVSIPASLEMTLRQWGVCDKRQLREIRGTIKRNSEDLMLEFLKREKRLTPLEKGCATAQTELLGIDFILTKINNVITPVAIEVNAHDCLYACFMYENTNMELQGQTSFVVVQTMMARSQRYLMQGKVVVVVGAGGYSKRRLWIDSQDIGVKIVLIDSNPDHFARNDVYMFLHFDMTDHKRDHEHADKLAKLIRKEVSTVDGCLTFWEDCVPLAALVAEKLGLKHASPYEAAMAAKKKSLTMEILLQYVSNPPHAKHPAFYASPVIRIDGPEDLESAIKQVPLPAIMKLEYGSSAFGVKLVRTFEEALEHVEFVQETLRTEADHPGIGLGHGNKLLLMRQLLGTEHDVDLVMFEGELMAAFISDNGPTRKPLCNETASAMPSVLCQEKQRQLVTGAAACCRTLGLHTGVFNVEMIMTPRGPQLIEINGRMGGFYLREWIRLLYGVDMLHMALMAACGVRPVTSSSIVKGYDSEKARRDSGQLLGIMLYASRHGHALATSATPERLWALHERGTIIFTQLEPEAEEASTEFEEPFGNLAVRAPTLIEACAKLVNMCEALGLETEESLKEILQDFVHI